METGKASPPAFPASMQGCPRPPLMCRRCVKKEAEEEIMWKRPLWLQELSLGGWHSPKSRILDDSV